jgi:hypothetical protein
MSHDITFEFHHIIINLMNGVIDAEILRCMAKNMLFEVMGIR